MNRIKNLVAISAFSLLVLGLPTLATAQWNGGYGNNGGYYGNQNLKSVVKNLKNKARRFETAVDRYDNRNDRYNNRNRRNDRYGGYGTYGGYGGYGNYNSGDLENLADQFSNAADRLEDAYGNGRNLNNSAGEARRVLDIAGQIERSIGNNRGGGNIYGQWNSMRGELNAIADVYYGNGYRNNDPYYRNDPYGNTRNRNTRNNGTIDWRRILGLPF